MATFKLLIGNDLSPMLASNRPPKLFWRLIMGQKYSRDHWCSLTVRQASSSAQEQSLVPQTYWDRYCLREPSGSTGNILGNSGLLFVLSTKMQLQELCCGSFPELDPRTTIRLQPSEWIIVQELLNLAIKPSKSLHLTVFHHRRWSVGHVFWEVLFVQVICHRFLMPVSFVAFSCVNSHGSYSCTGMNLCVSFLTAICISDYH